MNQTHLVEIGLTLGKLYKEKAELSFREWQLTQDSEARKLAITPAEGWPGKNEEARKTAALQAYTADASLVDMATEIAAIRGKILTAEASIQALEAERRGLEWAIRGQLVEKMSAIGVQPNGHGDPAETTFDDNAGYQVDRAAFQPPTDEDFPF